jgi:hypothetical protein
MRLTSKRLRVKLGGMNPSASVSVDAPRGTRPQDRARFFYSGAAALLLVLMFLGFQQFYLHGKAFPNRPLAPPIRMLLITHGIAMSAWMVLLLVQPLLVVNHKYRMHMTLGKVGAVLAACIFILGLKLGIEATRVSPPGVRLWNLPYKQFMAVPIISIAIFAGFVTAGLLNRRRPEIHRPMMLLATLAAIPAALDRMEAISALYRHTVWGIIFGPFFSSLVIGGVLLTVKWALTRKFDRYYAMGWAGLVVASAGIMKLATTDVWDGIASVLLRY